MLVGLEGSSAVGILLVWGLVDDDQSSNFSEVSSTQSSSFSEITDTQSPNWDDVAA